LILGLDVSTSCTGWCVLHSNGTLMEMGYVPLEKLQETFKKAERLGDKLLELMIDYPLSEIVIEENLQAFRPGLSSARTLMTLARFNGIVSYMCHDKLKIEPAHINVNVARKSVGLKINRKSDATTKQQVLDWVSLQLEALDYQWPVKILKSGPRKGMEILQPGCYDMADAYVIAKANLILNKR